jgi:hypothetical protein
MLNLLACARSRASASAPVICASVALRPVRFSLEEPRPLTCEPRRDGVNYSHIPGYMLSASGCSQKTRVVSFRRRSKYWRLDSEATYTTDVRHMRIVA